MSSQNKTIKSAVDKTNIIITLHKSLFNHPMEAIVLLNPKQFLTNHHKFDE